MLSRFLSQGYNFILCVCHTAWPLLFSAAAKLHHRTDWTRNRSDNFNSTRHELTNHQSQSDRDQAKVVAAILLDLSRLRRRCG